MSLSYFGTIIVSAALLSFQACKPPRPQSGGDDGAGSDSQSGVFPLDRNLISADQRVVTGTVLGKQGNRIAFRRTADQVEFLITISTLSASDQAFLNKLADGNQRAIAKIEASAAAAQKVPARQRSVLFTENYDRGAEQSKKEGLPMYLLFTGSDWCPPCQELERTILRSREFRKYADENLVLVKLDFPRAGSRIRSANQDLQRKFSVSTFPTVLLLNSDGYTLARLRGFGRTTPEEYVYRLKKTLKN